MSSNASANSFLSLPLSQSTSYSRRASTTSIPPQRLHQLSSAASLNPCLRSRSFTASPASTCFRNPMICCQ
jgi:hypothetical protein